MRHTERWTSAAEICHHGAARECPYCGDMLPVIINQVPGCSAQERP
jgi:hypothetical protein